MRRLLSLLLLFQAAVAQQRIGILSGVVCDSVSRERLVSANIRILGTSTGTSTNAEGAYRLLLSVGDYRITASCVGYRSDTLAISIDSTDMNRDFYLRVTPIPLPEVEVVGDPRDPGEQIIAKAIANKQKYLAQLRSYTFNAYTKTTMRVEADKESAKDTIIGGLLETQTQGYWEAPDRFKEIIVARRQSANFTSSQNMFAVGPIPNLNDDVVTIESNSIIGPTAPNASEYYVYKMLDTTAMDDVAIYRIRLIPKSKSRPLFDGTISIADKSFQVTSVDVHGNDAFDIAPITEARMRQQFSLFEKKFWLPVETITTYNVKLAFPGVPPILWQQYSLIYNYEINPELPGATFDRYMLTSLPTADKVDSSYWEGVNILPLTGEETRAYVRLDSIVTNSNFFVRSILWLSRAPFGLDGLPLTEFSDFFHFNRVEGAYLGAGVKVAPFSPLTTVTLRAGYGLADRRIKYSAGVEQSLESGKTWSIGGEIYRTLAYREGEEFIPRGDITWYALLGKNDPVDYYDRTGWSPFVRSKPLEPLLLELRYNDERDRSVTVNSDFSLFSRKEVYRPNPPVVHGDLRSIVFTLAYDTRKYFDMGFVEEPDNTKNSLSVMVQVERSDKDILNSDFQFIRCTGSTHGHVSTFSSGALDLYLRGEYAFETLPPQRIFDLYGSTSSLSHEGSLRTIVNRDYAGDRLATVLLEHNFGSLPFRTIGVPLLGSTDLILSVGGAWTGLSEESKTVQTVPLRTTRNAITEAGFGLNRLFSLFRLDFTWRLTERTGNNFAVTLGSAMF